MAETIPGSLSRPRQHLMLMVFMASIAVLTTSGCGRVIRFRITNMSGKAIAVTSGHTNKTVQIPVGESASVPHSSGDITVKLPDGTVWIYANLSPQQLSGTSFLEHEVYSPFACPDGYVCRGSSTAHLVLAKDGRLYVVTSDVKESDLETLEQPMGFPAKPDDCGRPENAVEPKK